jgi:spermidine/putrescine transport system substrate-binding protein
MSGSARAGFQLLQNMAGIGSTFWRGLLRRVAQRLLFAAMTMMLIASPGQAGGDLAIFNWESYMPPALLTRFEKETGISVAIDVYQSNEALLANLKAGTGLYDVVVPTDYMVEIMIDEGLLREIDAGEMANFKNVKAQFANPWFDRDRKFTAPYMWGTTGFFYDASQVNGGRLEESWKEFFDPRPELSGKIVAIDDQLSLYRAAAFYVGVDPCTEDPKEARKILDVLLAQKPKLAFYSSRVDIDAAARQILDGEIAMRNMWNGEAERLRRQAKNIVYVYPREGIEVWDDNFAVPANAPHPENARIFIDWMMNPRNIAEASNYTKYNNAIAGAETYMEPELLQGSAANPPAEYKNRFREARGCSPAARALNDKVWAGLWPRTVD